MSTQAGTYYDVIWESLSNSAMAAWFNGAGWRGWISPAMTAPGGSHEGQQGNRFDPRWVTSSWKLKSGRAIVAMRILQADWHELAALNPPGASIKIWERCDPFGALTFADPENPTTDELYANDVIYRASRRAAVRDAIRFYWPRAVDDGAGQLYNRGLRFAAFDESVRDHHGIGET